MVKSLTDKLPKPLRNRVTDISHDDDGYWATLATGWYWDGCTACHEQTWAKLVAAIREATQE